VLIVLFVSFLGYLQKNPLNELTMDELRNLHRTYWYTEYDGNSREELIRKIREGEWFDFD